MRSPWTREELAEMRRKLVEKIEQAEDADAEIRPLPPMSEGECLDQLLVMGKLMPLPDSFIFGQLLAQYRQSIEARMLGKHGRYFVISEEDVERLARTGK